MSINPTPTLEPLTETSIKHQCALNLTKFLNLSHTVQNAYCVERHEADGLRSALDATFDLTRFEYELLHFFDVRSQQGNMLDEATLSFETVRRVLQTCKYIYSVEDEIVLPDDMSQGTMDTFAQYFRHIQRVVDNIEEELHNMRLLKQCRVVAVTPQMRDHEHHFPVFISEMIRVIRDAGLRLEFEAPYLRKEDHILPEILPRVNAIRRSVKAEEYFFPFVLNTYKAWDNAYLEAARKKFENLPQRFVDVMLGLHELASVSHKMTLNEYCRTCVMFYNIQGFLKAGCRILSKENVQKPLNDVSYILVETLALIVQPKPKSPFKEDMVKIMREKLDRWRKDIRTTEIDTKTRGRIISKFRNSRTQYEFIDAQMKEDCYDYEECYCTSKALFNRYSSGGEYFECSATEVPRPSKNFLRILDHFKDSITMSSKEISAEKYLPDLYRDLSDESLCFLEETSKELKPDNHSPKVKSVGENLKMTFPSDKYVISRESDSNRQTPKYENDRSHFTKSSSADAVGPCIVSCKNKNRRILDISNPSAPKCKIQSVYMSNQTTNNSVVSKSSERPSGKYGRKEDASGDMPELHGLSCYKSAQATNSLTVVRTVISGEDKSCRVSSPTIVSLSNLCKDIYDNVRCQSTAQFTGVQAESESSRICQITHSPAADVPQPCGDSIENNSNKTTELLIKKPGGTVQTLNSPIPTQKFSEAFNKNDSCQTIPSSAGIKNSKVVSSGDSHLSANPFMKDSTRTSSFTAITLVPRVGKKSASGSTDPSQGKTEILSNLERTSSEAGKSTVSDKGVSDIHSPLGVGATAAQSQEAGSTESSEKVSARCNSESVNGHETLSTDEESFVVISDDDVRNLVTEEEYLMTQSHAHSARKAERSMCSVM